MSIKRAPKVERSIRMSNLIYKDALKWDDIQECYWRALRERDHPTPSEAGTSSTQATAGTQPRDCPYCHQDWSQCIHKEEMFGMQTSNCQGSDFSAPQEGSDTEARDCQHEKMHLTLREDGTYGANCLACPEDFSMWAVKFFRISQGGLG